MNLRLLQTQTGFLLFQAVSLCDTMPAIHLEVCEVPMRLLWAIVGKHVFATRLETFVLVAPQNTTAGVVKIWESIHMSVHCTSCRTAQASTFHDHNAQLETTHANPIQQV